MTALVRGGRDSDSDLTLVFGRVSKMVREARTEVRRMTVLPTQAAPGIIYELMRIHFSAFTMY